MTGHGVSITSADWTQTGSNVLVPQFQLVVSAKWLDDTTNLPHTVGPVTILFPDVVATFTPAEKAFFADQLKEIIIKIARLRAGVDAP